MPQATADKLALFDKYGVDALVFPYFAQLRDAYADLYFDKDREYPPARGPVEGAVRLRESAVQPEPPGA